MGKKTRTFALEDSTFVNITKIAAILGVSRSWLCEKVLKGYSDKFLEEHKVYEKLGEGIDAKKEIVELSGLFL